ncbi:Phosphatidylinositol-specific phospholipase C, X domain protein [Necator americanus]|uniref:Phosphoinositide phospholipase C n=1 Tax=Necator americanus TaxID=51031 RepID=W2SP10_NECAM|nr:Phosphatidylinositol-specific phospholipase C, X domain protein [Necator americanus]ETN71248.1 Phosphatidylinositol-specific phospholipase C, X domain protein [Necator americanus]
MVRYANKDYMTCQDLRLFLETEQGMVGVTSEFCENVVEQYEPSPEAKENNFMTVDGFTAFLLSKDCSIFDPSHSRVWMDMKQPFSKYFIASSHKTYLIEDQQGPADEDGLTSALKKNSRMIELDIWDPSETKGEKEPMVQNGLLALSKIPLSEALKAIRQSAFERSRYPLILRLSVHCSCEWQKVAAKLIVTHLGTKASPGIFQKLTSEQIKLINFSYTSQQLILLTGVMKKLYRLLGTSSRGSLLWVSVYAAPQKPARFPRTMMVSPVLLEENRDGRIRLCRELSDLVPPFLQMKTLNDLMATAPNSHSMNPRQHVAYLSETTALRLTHTYAQEFAQTSRDYVVW